MVSPWRPGLHYRRLGHGPGHGAGTWLSILWPCEKKICFVNDLGMHGFYECYNVPVVLVGLFIGFFAIRKKWLYWGFEALGFASHFGSTKSGITFDF